MDKLAPPISHKTVLKYSGLIGFCLPIVLIFGSIMAFDNCQKILQSISTYYHSGLGDYFVASLAALSFCFYVYSGYSATDRILSNVASIAMLGVAFLPTYVQPPFDSCLLSNSRSEIIGDLHYACAAVLFLILAFFCIVQFPKGDKPFSSKKNRINMIFRGCGIIIIIAIILIARYSLYLSSKYPILATYSPVLWLEAIALWAFSISWFIKGEVHFNSNSLAGV